MVSQDSDALRRALLIQLAARNFDERFWDKVQITETCWVWTAGKLKGYGRFNGASGEQAAHRWGYERYVAAIPDGLQLDHLCRNRACVRFDHLEPVTPKENIRRAVPYGVIGQPRKNASVCKNGHEFTPENTRWKKRQNVVSVGYEKRCRACGRDYKRRARERKAA